ncbi:MAG: hypothetical protein AAGB46_10960 [Verrucomicrobiota bacterium]
MQSTVFIRTYPKTSSVVAESSCGSERGALKKRTEHAYSCEEYIMEVLAGCRPAASVVFAQNAAQAHKKLSPTGLAAAYWRISPATAIFEVLG